MSDHILSIEPVTNILDALAMRKIRNECREFMTQDVEKIGLLRQVHWFYNSYSRWMKEGSAIAFVGWVDQTNPIAYGLIRDLDTGITIISGGVRKAYRGRGYGLELFTYLTERASHMEGVEKRPVYLEVLDANKIAQSLYKKLGYEEIQKDHGIITMVKKYE